MDPEGIRDEDLLARFLGGDERCFERLVRRHEDRIFSLCLKVTGERADALEAMQETFISLFRQASSFRGDSAFGTWLYRIGINACRDLLRRRKRLPVPEEDLLEVAGDALGRTETRLDESASLRIDLSRALARLPEEYREAVVLHDLGGAPYEVVARLTGAPVGTVKSRISRGRRLLAGYLEQRSEVQASKDRR
ncbi:MAG: sigma-70 family RNA polymerase sigma factor [Actinomycetota bacterium]